MYERFSRFSVYLRVLWTLRHALRASSGADELEYLARAARAPPPALAGLAPAARRRGCALRPARAGGGHGERDSACTYFLSYAVQILCRHMDSDDAQQKTKRFNFDYERVGC